MKPDFFISVCLLGPKGQGDSAASPSAGAGAVQDGCADDPAAPRRGEEPVAGADGHPGGDGSLRL